MPISTPKDFLFRFKYYGGNVLDLFKKTFTRDMVVDPDLTIPFLLSPMEIDTIYAEMRMIDLFNFPKYTTERSWPPFHNRFIYIIQLDSLQRIFTFDISSYNSANDTVHSVQRLSRKIIEMIENSPSVKALPKPRGKRL